MSLGSPVPAPACGELQLPQTQQVLQLQGETSVPISAHLPEYHGFGVRCPVLCAWGTMLCLSGDTARGWAGQVLALLHSGMCREGPALCLKLAFGVLHMPGRDLHQG